MTVRILAAGDHFLLPAIFTEAIGAELARSGLPEAEFRALQTPWPAVPFGPVAEVEEGSGSEAEMIEALRGVQVMVANHAPLTERILANAPDLKLAVIARGGPTNANVPAATRRGVVVCNAPGRNASATAEHAMALILAVLRRVPEAHATLAAGTWRGDYYEFDRAPLELDEATVGLIGCGAIGVRVARMLGAFGASVLVYDPYVKPEMLAGLATPVALDELLRRSRVVSLHARATPQTRGILGRREIGLMPHGSVVVNCARGSLLDYDAVCDALDSGHLWGAGLDVFPEEPIPPGSRLLRTRNIVMTPHMAGCSQQTAQRAAKMAAAEIGRYFRGEPMAHCLNPEALKAARGEDS
jgi:D-3-phosphoglycerate dehydrogenase / 2-oxoglutarate reductase